MDCVECWDKFAKDMIYARLGVFAVSFCPFQGLSAVQELWDSGLGYVLSQVLHCLALGSAKTSKYWIYWLLVTGPVVEVTDSHRQHGIMRYLVLPLQILHNVAQVCHCCAFPLQLPHNVTQICQCCMFPLLVHLQALQLG